MERCQFLYRQRLDRECTSSSSSTSRRKAERWRNSRGALRSKLFSPWVLRDQGENFYLFRPLMDSLNVDRERLSALYIGNAGGGSTSPSSNASRRKKAGDSVFLEGNAISFPPRCSVTNKHSGRSGLARP